MRCTLFSGWASVRPSELTCTPYRKRRDFSSVMPYRLRPIWAHSWLIARNLHVSSTKRIPALTKNDIEENTDGNASSATWPLASTASNTSTALAKANATSCTGVAPTSCRWYEHTFIGFHFGACTFAQAIMSTMIRREASGGKINVPRDKYSLSTSFWVVPRNSLLSTPFSAALATYKANSQAAVELMVIDVFIDPGGISRIRARMCSRCTTGTPTLPTSPRARTWSGS